MNNGTDGNLAIALTEERRVPLSVVEATVEDSEAPYRTMIDAVLNPLRAKAQDLYLMMGWPIRPDMKGYVPINQRTDADYIQSCAATVADEMDAAHECIMELPLNSRLRHGALTELVNQAWILRTLGVVGESEELEE